MSVRDDSIGAHPDFPWLEAGGVAGVESLMQLRNWLRVGEVVESCDKAGEGNMNLTLRVRTDRRTFILKQARPWVEKFEDIAAPWDRVLFEQRFYERAAAIPEVTARMPQLIASDEVARVVLIEDLGEARDFSDLYSAGTIHEDELRSLAIYLRALHDATRGEPDPVLANREMRALNHLHIFEVPLDAENGVDLEVRELWLEQAAGELRTDAEFCAEVHAVGERYLEDGPCLVHGDYFPGSWLRVDGDVRVIDPEFCFYGDAEFDLGVCIAHLRMSEQEFDLAKTFLSAYAGRDVRLAFDMEWVARYASVEVMRRIIGVAQLPIPPSQGLRAGLLKRARKTLLECSVEELWS